MTLIDAGVGFLLVAILVLAFLLRVARRMGIATAPRSGAPGSHRSRPQSQPPVPAAHDAWKRGGPEYLRSRESIGIAPFARQAQGMPPYHDENSYHD